MVAAGTLSASAGLTGCQSNACTNTSLNADDPSPAIECPSGDLCYRGSCIRACSAGQERAQVCTADSECDSARPRCIDGFCSICAASQTCVPILNICQEIQDVPRPDVPDRPMVGAVQPNRPLDPQALDGGSYFKGGLTRILDAGEIQEPELAEVTHAGFVDVAYEEDYGAGAPPAPISRARVTAFDVRNNGLGLTWRPDLVPPRIQCVDTPEVLDGCGMEEDFSLGPCSIRRLRTVTASVGQVPVPADIGDVLIDSQQNYPGSINQAISATFMGGNYVLTPLESALTGNVLVFSVLPNDLRFLLVTGQPVMGVTAGSWPASSDVAGHHVPYRLIPAAATTAALATRTIVTSPPTQDLDFQWERIDVGDDAAERVVVRIEGANNELVCTAFEGSNGADTIRVQAGMLVEWRNREPAGVYRLNFERVNRRGILVTPAMGLKIDMTIRIRHTLISEIEFR